MPNRTRRIKNWEKFQHYKSGPHADKPPEWIKVYRNLLNDIEWHELQDTDKAVLVELWMLASERGGALPPLKEIAFRLRRSEKTIISVLDRLPSWVEESSRDCIDAIYTPSSLEVEGEVEGEVEKNLVNGHAVDPLDASFSRAFENYNKAANALGLPKAERLTSTRRTKLKARLREHELSGWNRALQNVAEMPFCCGENDRGWRINLDWMLEPRNFTKLLERAYGRPERPADGI